MIQAVGAVAAGERPSLGKVVRHLEESADPAWKNLGAVLRSISEMRLARLCFAPSGGAADRRRGLDDRVHAGRPDPAGHHDRPRRLLLRAAAVGRPAVPGLPVRPAAAQRHRPDRAEGDLPRRGVGDHVHARRAPSWSPRSPGWAGRGTRRCPDLAERGRPAERAGHQLHVQRFRVPLLGAGPRWRTCCRSSGVEPSEEHKAVLRGLGNGECIFRDLDGRAGRIGVDLVSEELRDWIDTNPTRARPGSRSPRRRCPVTAPADARSLPMAEPRMPASLRPGSRSLLDPAGAALPQSCRAGRAPRPGRRSAAGCSGRSPRQRSAAVAAPPAAAAADAAATPPHGCRELRPDRARRRRGGHLQRPGHRRHRRPARPAATRGQSGVIGDLNNICTPSLPEPEPADSRHRLADHRRPAPGQQPADAVRQLRHGRAVLGGYRPAVLGHDLADRQQRRRHGVRRGQIARPGHDHRVPVGGRATASCPGCSNVGRQADHRPRQRDLLPVPGRRS